MRDRDYAEAVQAIEDHTAAILSARESCTDLEILFRALTQRGLISPDTYQEAVTHLNVIRRGLELGRKYAHRARRTPFA